MNYKKQAELAFKAVRAHLSRVSWSHFDVGLLLIAGFTHPVSISGAFHWHFLDSGLAEMKQTDQVLAFKGLLFVGQRMNE